MLWNAATVNGYAVAASDGQIGTVSDLLFDDAGWTVRWLVVDTGHLLSGRKVLLPPSALGKPDPVRRQFPVRLTMRQVENSPDIDTERPVSRQIEAAVYNYYDLNPYWGGSDMLGTNAVATPLVASLWASPPHGDSDDGAQPGGDDPHLRSIAAVTGYHIHATDGEIGHVEDFLVDDATWNIRYVVVDTRNWWPGEKVLISPYSAREIDWGDRLVHLDVERQKVRNGPSYDPAITLDGAYDEKFQTYYGIKWVTR